MRTRPSKKSVLQDWYRVPGKHFCSAQRANKLRIVKTAPSGRLQADLRVAAMRNSMIFPRSSGGVQRFFEGWNFAGT